MLRVLDLRAGVPSSTQVNQLVPRASLSIESAIAEILPLIDEIRVKGESALIAATKKFDGFDPSPIPVPQSELDAALANISPALKSSLTEAIARVRKVSEANLPKPVTTTLSPGGKVHQRWQPVDSVGLYVPGGKAVYPSSVVMNVVPAQVAGVPRMVIATPGQKAFQGRPHPTVLAAAAMLGITEVYNVGGPAAIAALAHGVPELELSPVSLITGPGNIYVTAAKRALRGIVGIDSEAGTTEILIIADSGANPEFVAADLLSQAEHDESAASVLVTDSEELANQVQIALLKRLDKTSHAQRAKTALTAQQSAIVLVANIHEAVKFANFYATEHLELQTENAQEVLSLVSNAGAIFIGAYSPVSLGDYMAGSNHVLPVNQQSKFGAGLSVHTFLRAQQIIDYNKEGLAETVSLIDSLANEEGLPAHFEAIQARFE
ncbi:MAG: histidinol dehydrogenase [Actinobacteria bacterium]|nr:histidinol dehydrogenase [Actinomycetota bacterium]